MSALKFTSVVFCEDIRREISNKEILIGVYSGDVVVPNFPAPINAAYWMEGTTDVSGLHELDMRLSLKDADVKIVMKLGITVGVPGAFALSLPPLQIMIDRATELWLEYLDGDSWTLLKVKKIIRGDPPQTFNLATASPPPSEQSPPAAPAS